MGLLNSQFVVLVISYVCCMQLYSVQSQCQITIATAFHGKSPVFMDNRMAVYYPDRNTPNVIQFPWFQDRLVYCPGRDITLNNQVLAMRADNPHSIPPVIRCIRDQTFELEDGTHRRFQLQELACSGGLRIQDAVTNDPCQRGQGRIINLGHEVAGKGLKPLIQLCHNTQLETTVWAHSVIAVGIAGKQKNADKRDFIKGSSFSGVNVETFYQPCSQIDTLTELFRSDIFTDDKSDSDRMDDSDDELTEAQRQAIEDRNRIKENELRDLVRRYMRNDPTDGNRKNYFEKGHLIANADKFYASEQYATYFFTNALPMWKSINQGNWKQMESDVRNMAATKGSLRIWAGAIGILQLEDKDIYLGRKLGSPNPVMPAPKILFKLVYSEEQNQALVFLAINNPYVEANDIPQHIICREYARCRTVYPRNDNIYNGYMYCCTYQDFIASPEVTALEFPNLLPANVQPLV